MVRSRIDTEAIERAALALGDEGGLEAITARNLADRLGVTPMALYRHVPSISAVTDRLFARVVAEGALLDHATSDLAPWLVETFARIRGALLEHPFVVPLAGSAAGYGPVALGVVDAVLGRMVAAGMSLDAAVPAFHALLSFTLGATSVEAASRRAGAGTRRGPRLRAGDPALAGHPHVRAAAPALARFGSDQSFRAGLARVAAAFLAA